MINKFDNMRFVLALPEVGSIAISCDEKLRDGELIFHETDDSIIEIGEEHVISKIMLMPTPIIRYKTNLHLKSSTSVLCSCGLKSYSYA